MKTIVLISVSVAAIVNAAYPGLKLFTRQQGISNYPPECEKPCGDVNGVIAENNGCPVTQCCVREFVGDYFECFECVGSAVNTTDWTYPQQIIDQLTIQCISAGYSLDKLTFEGQVPSPTGTAASPAVSSSISKTIVIVGSVLGPLIALVVCLTAIYLLRRRHIRKSRNGIVKTRQDSIEVGVLTEPSTRPASSVPQPAMNLPRSLGQLRLSPFLLSRPTVQLSRKEIPAEAAISPDQPCSAGRRSSSSFDSTASRLTDRQILVREQVAALQREIPASADSEHQSQQETHRLRAEISRLHDLLRSDWALGFTDEPPPSYSAPETRTSDARA